VVIPGGSGSLGQALTERLVARGDDVVVLTGGRAREADGWRAVTWDGRFRRVAAELEWLDSSLVELGAELD